MFLPSSVCKMKNISKSNRGNFCLCGSGSSGTYVALWVTTLFRRLLVQILWLADWCHRWALNHKCQAWLTMFLWSSLICHFRLKYVINLMFNYIQNLNLKHANLQHSSTLLQTILHFCQITFHYPLEGNFLSPLPTSTALMCVLLWVFVPHWFLSFSGTAIPKYHTPPAAQTDLCHIISLIICILWLLL